MDLKKIFDIKNLQAGAASNGSQMAKYKYFKYFCIQESKH
jgi:hypothetical protein